MNPEAVPSHRSPILAEKFVLQYSFAAASNAAAVPLINEVGVGLTFTICKSDFANSWLLTTLAQHGLIGLQPFRCGKGAICLIVSGLLVFVVARWGSDMERAGMKTFPGLFKGVDFCQ